LYLISQNLDPLSESSSLAHGEQSGCTWKAEYLFEL
jgi:hypothetical protein